MFSETIDIPIPEWVHMPDFSKSISTQCKGNTISPAPIHVINMDMKSFKMPIVSLVDEPESPKKPETEI